MGRCWVGGAAGGRGCAGGGVIRVVAAAGIGGGRMGRSGGWERWGLELERERDSVGKVFIFAIGCGVVVGVWQGKKDVGPLGWVCGCGRGGWS